MARFCASSRKSENSLAPLIAPRSAVNRLAAGPDMLAWKRGFWRSNAASKVEPARGNPEMKWMACSNVDSQERVDLEFIGEAGGNVLLEQIAGGNDVIVHKKTHPVIQHPGDAAADGRAVTTRRKAVDGKVRA